jgi:hypothetical protein
LDRATQKLVRRFIAAELSYRLRTGQEVSLAEISNAIQNRYHGLATLDNQRLAFRKAAEEALRRKASA